MSEPPVRLHDVSIMGDADQGDAVLAAIERAVAQATTSGRATPETVSSAVRASVAEVRRS